MNSLSFVALVFCAVLPLFEYRGKIPGDRFALLNSEPFYRSVNHRIETLENNDPETWNNVVRSVNSVFPSNGFVNIDIGLKSVNGIHPSEQTGDVTVDAMSYTNALLSFSDAGGGFLSQHIYHTEVINEDVIALAIPSPIPGANSDLSRRYSFFVETRKPVQVVFKGFEENNLFVPDSWSGFIQAGMNKLDVTEIQKSVFKLDVLTFELFHPSASMPIHFTAAEDGATVSIIRNRAGDFAYEYSLDFSEWNLFEPGKTSVVLNSGEAVYFRAVTNNPIAGIKFSIKGGVYCDGNIQYLLWKENPLMEAPDHAYDGLFADCESLLSCPELPATKIGEESYASMFVGCSRLVDPPVLPAIIVGPAAYYGMFANCKSLKTTPSFDSLQEMSESCCASMFENCAALTEVRLPPVTPGMYSYNSTFVNCGELKTLMMPAAATSAYCYYNICQGCTNLSNVVISSTNMVEGAFNSAFKGCERLNNVSVKFSTWETDSLGRPNSILWLYGVSLQGVFHSPIGLEDRRGEDFIPLGWDVVYE